MTDREKLIALLKEANAEAAAKIERGEIEDNEIGWEFLANHLISRGVTVQRWIPVTERLPEEGGYYMVAHQRSGCVAERFYYRDCPDLFVEVTGDPVTHWMPLPKPPKEEKR